MTTESGKKIPNHPEARKIYDRLELQRHPAEFGWYKEMYKSTLHVDRRSDGADRSAMTSIYFLQESAAHPQWRHLKSDEIFVWIRGAPVELHLLDENTGKAEMVIIGDPLDTGKRMDGDTAVANIIGSQHTIPAGIYFNSDVITSNNEPNYALMACVVAPGFEFGDFRLVTQDELHEKFPDHMKLIDRFF